MKSIQTYSIWSALAIAAALWFLMFSPWTSHLVNFWTAMTVSALVLTTLSTVFCKEWTKDMHFNLKELVFGLVIAFALWWIFWLGHRIAGAIFSFESEQVGMIYAMKAQTNPNIIALLLLCIIGPAEEIFWRGFIQRRMMKKWNRNVGFIVATACYTAVHLPSLNFMLIMAALVVGFCWGAIYRFFPRHLSALIVSHAVWDACAFVFFPF
jgi:membrane protease YdiL (CAAX protease family)